MRDEVSWSPSCVKSAYVFVAPSRNPHLYCAQITADLSLKMSLFPSRNCQLIYRRYLTVIAGLALTLFLAALVACSDDDGGDGTSEDTSPGATGSAPAQSPEEQATPATTQDIDPATGLPRTFPAEFPVYTGAEVFRASEHQDRYVIEWHSVDPIANVVEFYQTGLAAAPWQLDGSEEVDGVTTLEFSGETDRQYTGSLAIAELSDQTRMFLNLNFGE